MAETLHAEEAEFWLPAEFLTDEEDILINNKDNLNRNKNPNNFSFPSEFPFELTIQQKQRGSYGIVGSPQSALSQFGNHFFMSPGSSKGGSPNGPSQVSSPTTQFAPVGNSLDLIYQAAAQIAELKLKGGDVSQTKYSQQNLNNSPASYKAFVQQLREEQILNYQQHRAVLWSINQSKNGSIFYEQKHKQLSGFNVGDYLENDQSAWPSLQYVMQKNIQKNCGNREMLQSRGSGNGYFNSVKKSSVGTGVFLPRRYENSFIQSKTNKRTGCSTTSFHGRGEMYNAHVSGGGCSQPQWQPRLTVIGGLCSDYDVQLAQKNAILIHQSSAHHPHQQVALGHELGLPQEWTY